MMYMFISRLYRLIVTQAVSEMSNHNKLNGDREAKITPTMTMKETRMLNVAIRVTILTLISLISSIFTVVFRGWAAYLQEIGNYDGYLYAGTVSIKYI